MGFEVSAINKFWRRIWRGDARRGALCAGVACSSVGSIGLGGGTEDEWIIIEFICSGRDEGDIIVVIRVKCIWGYYNLIMAFKLN